MCREPAQQQGQGKGWRKEQGSRHPRTLASVGGMRASVEAGLSHDESAGLCACPAPVCTAVMTQAGLDKRPQDALIPPTGAQRQDNGQWRGQG